MGRPSVPLTLSMAEATALREVAQTVLERPNLLRMQLTHHCERDAAQRAVQALDAAIKKAYFGEKVR